MPWLLSLLGWNSYPGHLEASIFPGKLGDLELLVRAAGDERVAGGLELDELLDLDGGDHVAMREQEIWLFYPSRVNSKGNILAL